MNLPDQRRPRVLMLRSNPIAPDPRVEKIARALYQGGYPLTALGWDRSGNLPATEESAGFRVIRLAVREKYRKGLGNLGGMLRWQWTLLNWLVKQRSSFEVLHACDFDTVLPALLCKLLFRKRVVYDIFDFYADFLRRTPGWLKRIIAGLDRAAINASDAVILADDSRVEQIAGSQPRNLTVIYNSPEDVAADQMPQFQPSAAGKLRVAYIGLLQVERGLFEMLEVLSRHPEWRLDVGGFGGEEAQIRERISQLPNVAFHGRLSYEQTLALSWQADVLFATYDPAIPNHRYSSPNKVFEAMMLAKPIITARGTNADRIALDAGNGVVVNYGSIAELEAACVALATDPNRRLALGIAGRKAYENVYSWDRMSLRLLDLYATLSLMDTSG